MWVLPFRSLYSPFFLGALVCFSMVARVSSLSGYISPNKKEGLVRSRTYITQGVDERKEAPSSKWPCAAPSFRTELVSGCCLDSDTLVKVVIKKMLQLLVVGRCCNECWVGTRLEPSARIFDIALGIREPTRLVWPSTQYLPGPGWFLASMRYMPGASREANLKQIPIPVSTGHVQKSIPAQKPACMPWWNFGFQCVRHGWSKVCTSYFVYSQIWRNLHKDDCHLFCIFLWMISI